MMERLASCLDTVMMLKCLHRVGLCGLEGTVMISVFCANAICVPQLKLKRSEDGGVRDKAEGDWCPYHAVGGAVTLADSHA